MKTDKKKNNNNFGLNGFNKNKSFSVQMFYNWKTFDNFKQVCLFLFCLVCFFVFFLFFLSSLHSRPTAEKENDVFIIIIYLIQKKWTDVAVYLFFLFMYLMWQLSLVSRKKEKKKRIHC